MSRRPDLFVRRLRLHGDARLAQLGLTFLLAGVVLSMAELIALGTLTAPALGLETIGAGLIPVGIIAMLRSSGRAGDDPAADDDGSDGGHGGDDDPESPRPTGGLEIDWARFEREFHAYAEARAETIAI